MNKVPDVSALLLEHHMEYQKRMGRYVTMKEFAAHIDMNDKQFSMIYHKKRPLTREMARKFADVFDDLRFFDAAGEERPNEITYRIEREWSQMPEEYRSRVRDVLANYLTDKKHDVVLANEKTEKKKIEVFINNGLHPLPTVRPTIRPRNG